MDQADRYQVNPARDDLQNLKEVLEYIATSEGHIRIVGVTWQPARTDGEGRKQLAGYTIISERGEG